MPRLRGLLFALFLVSLVGCGQAHALDDLGPVGAFQFTDRSGKTITQDDLRGKVWIASFVFVRCTSHCPQITGAMRELQSDLRDVKDLRLVTFTVDPAHDRAAELAEYAEKFQADPEKWLFLTGEESAIDRLLQDQFKVGATRPGEKPGELMHSIRLVLVDQAGRIRGYYDGMAAAEMVAADPTWAREHEEKEKARLRADVRSLTAPAFDFPLFHAGLNTVATLLLVLGGLAIWRRAIRLHVLCMLTTLAISTLFLGSYLYFHLVVKGGVATRFQDQNPTAPDWARYTYLAILLSHTVLAAIITPLAVWTAYLGWTGDYARHRPLAKWVLPIWLYVTTTGVVVYWMLYRMYATG